MSFVIPKRATALGDAATRAALERVAVPWDVNANGDYVFEHGFQLEHVRALMQGTPRGFHLLAKHGFIPITEEQAVSMLFKAGLTFEQKKLAVARVRHATPGASKNLMLMMLERGYKNPLSKPQPTEPPKVFSL